MKNNVKKYMRQVFVIFVVAILLFLISGSCHNSDRPMKKDIIPRGKFTSVLSDIYLADGMLILPAIHSKFQTRDSIDAYIDIIQSHGYTYEAMQKTLEYYFFRKPKKMVRIYDHILGDFTEIETRIENTTEESPRREINLWTGNPVFYYPAPEGSGDPLIDQTMKAPGTFTLTFTIVIYPDDPSVNPHLSLWYCNADSVGTGKRTYIRTLNYIKDGQPHNYVINGSVRENHPVVIKGNLLEREDFRDELCRHARISGISLTMFQQPA